MEIKDSHLLEEFLKEQSSYSADFKALVLRIYQANSGDLAKTASLSGLSERSLRQWISVWNGAEGDKKKSIQ